MGWLNDILSLVYPEQCVVCTGPVLPAEDHVCLGCRTTLPGLLTSPISNHLPLKNRFEGLLHLEHVLVFLQFSKGGSTQRLLHALKYGRRPEVGQVLGRLMAAALEERGLKNAFDLILPIPLHSGKLKTRGYNQAMEFAIGLAQGFACQASDEILIRKKATETQTRKGKLERILNVKEVFALDESQRHLLRNQRILLVDDVVTTGSTLESCGRLLEREPIGNLSIATIAMA
jgi:ComF family protein